jgi:small subunit ribosomal protein S4
VKRFYGIGEKPFRNFFQKAAKKKGITGENLLRALELRFDNILYRMNFAYSRAHARQIIRHGHLTVNGKKVTIPSYQIRLDDEISFSEKSTKNENIKTILEDLKGLVEVPEWLVVDSDKFTGKVNSIPKREDVSLDIEEHLIVELYSK